MSIYAIAEIEGLQYKIAKDQVFEVKRVIAKKDKTFTTNKVLLVKDGKKVSVGSPYIKGASLKCEVLKDFRGKKVIAYKYKRRKGFDWKKGHRQNMSLLKVKQIKVE